MHRFLCLAVLFTAAPPAIAADEAIAKPIAAIKAVTREGKNNDVVGEAWSSLVSQGGAALMPALEAIDDSNPTASNWLQTAVSAIAEAEVKAKRPLPAEKLEAFVKNVKNAQTARAVAYELLAGQDKSAQARMLPTFLNDPNPDLRRAAVASELAGIEKKETKADLERILGFARDPDQVEAIAKKLEKDFQVKVVLTEHFGSITQWDLIGPFASSQGKALTLKHRPEEKVVPDEKLKGKGDADVLWKPFLTRQRYGVVDFNQELGKNYDAAGYAFSTVSAEKESPVEVRVTSPNALQIYLNGKKLFEREEYHHGENMDYHVGKGQLQPGRNTILIKVCQNNQKEMWAQKWQFSARVCDATGAPIPGVMQLVGDKKVKLGSIPN